MKKTTPILFGMSLIFLIASCSKKSDNPPAPLSPPTIKLQTGAGFATGTSTAPYILAPQDTFRLGWIATKGTGDLQTFSINQDGNITDYNAGNDVSLTANHAASFQSSYRFTAPNNTGLYNYNLKVTATDGKDASVSLPIKVALTAIYSSRTLSAQNENSDSSFFSTSEGKVYSETDAKANSNKVDIVYYYSSNNATIASPDDATVPQIFKDSINGVNNWSTRNKTLFKKTSMSVAQFDAISSNNGIRALIQPFADLSILADSKITNLSVDNVIAFQTASGMVGLLKITSITTDINGSIQFIARVQKAQ